MPDRAAADFAETALSHVDALHRLARRLTRSQADADDLVQECYARAFRKRDHFEPGTNLKAWLFRILRNVHIDHHRRDRLAPVTAANDDTALESASTGEPLRGDAELELLRSVVADDIEAALAGLSYDARTIVLLDLEGFTEAELASVLECAAGTVKSRLARARAALRRTLADYAGGRGSSETLVASEREGSKA